MITPEEVTAVGYVNKTHGIKGELSITFDNAMFDEDEVDYFVFDMDGIFVPFFVDSFRFKTDKTALYKFKDVDSEETAREFAKKTIFLANKFIEEATEEELGLHYFVGFEVFDKNAGYLGKIKEIDESTQNVLFVIDNKKEELLIPATDYYITDVDETNKAIHMDLPEGLVDFDMAEME